MKAFLTSDSLEQKHFDKFKELLSKPKVPKALFITTASVPYGHNPKPDWLDRSLGEMSQFAETVDEISLEEEHIPDDLSQYGFIFIGGGSVFYLAYRLAETGLDKKIKKYVKDEGVFSGSSAGAIILMNDIGPYASVDDPSQAPKMYPGLGLVDFAVLPHADNEKYGPLMHKLAKDFQKNEYQTSLFNDNQVLVIDGDKREII